MPHAARSTTPCRRRFSATSVLAVALVTALAALAAGVTTAGASPPALDAANVGAYRGALVDASNQSLYVLTSEQGAVLQCTGGCLDEWLPLLVSDSTSSVTVGAGVAGTVGFVARGSGMQQVTYNSFPVYTYAGDGGPLEDHGQGLPFGGGATWYLTDAAATTAAATPYTTAPPPPPFLSTLGTISTIGSTVPADGDVNPYGVATVTASHDDLVRGDVLVSNFNDAANVQGTGRSLVEIAPSGTQRLFARIGALPPRLSCPGGIGLSTALAILPGGDVVVGSVPAAGPSGAPSTAVPAGCLLVLDDRGAVVATWRGHGISGPWDLTTLAHGSSVDVYVANDLVRPAGSRGAPRRGTGTVVRLDVSLHGPIPQLVGSATIGTGFPWEVNASTFVEGPTGLAVTAGGDLYVAETLTSTVTEIHQATSRTRPVAYGTATIASGGALQAPLGMTLVPGGDVVVANGGDGDVVELSPSGHQVAEATLAANGAGDLFGLALTLDRRGLVFVNDGANTLQADT